MSARSWQARPDRRNIPVDHQASANRQLRLEGTQRLVPHVRRARWPDKLWKATSIADCSLILGIHALGLPEPPNVLTFAVLLGVLVLAYFSAIACVMSR